jgi:hypothetical protein
MFIILNQYSQLALADCYILPDLSGFSEKGGTSARVAVSLFNGETPQKPFIAKFPTIRLAQSCTVLEGTSFEDWSGL